MEHKHLTSLTNQIALFDPNLQCPLHQKEHDPRNDQQHSYEYIAGQDGIPIIRCCAEQQHTELRFQELRKQLKECGGDINQMIRKIADDPNHRDITKNPRIAELNIWKGQLKWKLVEWFEFSKVKCEDKLIINQQSFVCDNRHITLPLPPSLLVTKPPRLIFQSKNESVIKAKLFPETLLLPKGKTNNFRQTIQKDFGIGSYSDNYQFSSQLPQKITVNNMFRASAKKCNQIQKTMMNHERLPLEIRPSTVPEAGRGVFTHVKIPADTFVMVYVGQQINALQNWPPSDSVFDIGFISQPITSQNQNNNPASRLIPWVIDPTRKLNAGRYINSFEQTNLRMEKMSFKIGKSCLNQIVGLVLISTRQIQVGQQLSYSYGQNYGFGEDFMKFSDWKGGYFSRYMAGIKGDPHIPLIIRKWRNQIKKANQLYQCSSEEQDNASSICENQEIASTVADVMEQMITDIQKIVRNPLTQRQKQFDKILIFEEKPDMHVREKLGKIYRQFSRQKYNKYRHQFPRMRQSQIVSKIVKQWDSKTMEQKIQFHQHALDINSYANESESSEYLESQTPRHQLQKRNPTKKINKQEKADSKKAVRCFVDESSEEKAPDSDFQRQIPKQFIIGDQQSVSQQIGQPSSPTNKRTLPRLLSSRFRVKKEKPQTIKRPISVGAIPFRLLIPFIEKISAQPIHKHGINLRQTKVTRQIENIYFFTGQTINRKSQFGLSSYFQCRMCGKQVTQGWKMRHLREKHRQWVVSYEVKQYLEQRKRFWILAEAPIEHCNDIESWALIDDSPSYKWKNKYSLIIRHDGYESYVKKGWIRFLLQVDYTEKDNLKVPHGIQCSQIGTKQQKCCLRAVVPEQCEVQIQQLIQKSSYSWSSVWNLFKHMVAGSKKITKQDGTPSNIYQLIYGFYRQSHQRYRVYSDGAKYITISSKALLEQQKVMKGQNKSRIKSESTKIPVIEKKRNPKKMQNVTPVITENQPVVKLPLEYDNYLPIKHLQQSSMEYFNCPNCQKVLSTSNIGHVSYCIKYIRPCEQCGVLVDRMQTHQCCRNRNTIQLADNLITVQRNIEISLIQNLNHVDEKQCQKTQPLEKKQSQIDQAKKEHQLVQQEFLHILDPHVNPGPCDLLNLKINYTEKQLKKPKRRNHTQYMEYHRDLYRSYFVETIKRLKDPKMREKLSIQRGWTKHELNIKIQKMETQLQRLDDIQGKNMCQICLSYISPHVQAGNHRLLQLSANSPNHILVLESIRKSEQLNAFGVSPYLLYANIALVRQCRQCRKSFHRICWSQNFSRADHGIFRCPNCRGNDTVMEPDRVIFSGAEDIFIDSKPVYGFSSIMDIVGVKVGKPAVTWL